MAKLYAVLFGVLLCQWINAAPSEIKLEDIADVISADQPEESKSETLLEEPAQGQRHKRWYDYLGFGLPPINPLLYKRDDSENTGVYGTENPFVQIHRRLQDISGFIRNPITNTPPFPVIPPILPVLYIPQVGCGCTPSNQPERPEDRPVPGTVNITDVGPRWPEIEDDRQNWGLLNNDTVEDGNDNDGARPISFDPIRPSRPNIRPPPPVEHGSEQGDINSLSTTYRPIAPTTFRPVTTTFRPITQGPNGQGDVKLQPPSVCDTAVLSCCIRGQVPDLYSCFVENGCPDPSAYGSPCDSGVILQVIDRFQKFYNQRNSK